MGQLEEVLQYLNTNKLRDPLGYCNEIFSPDICGDDLKSALIFPK